MAPAASMADLTTSILWMLKLSITTRSPGRSHGARRVRTKRKKMRPLTAPRYVITFGFAPSRIAPMSATVFHDLKGRVPTTRSPRRLQPNSRRIPVLQNDSSMKTSRFSLTARTSAQKTRRRSRLSGVSRSTATKDFFFASTRVG